MANLEILLFQIKMRFAFSLFAFSLLSRMLLGIAEETDTQEPFLLTDAQITNCPRMWVTEEPVMLRL